MRAMLNGTRLLRDVLLCRAACLPRRWWLGVGSILLGWFAMGFAFTCATWIWSGPPAEIAAALTDLRRGLIHRWPFLRIILILVGVYFSIARPWSVWLIRPCRRGKAEMARIPLVDLLRFLSTRSVWIGLCRNDFADPLAGLARSASRISTVVDAKPVREHVRNRLLEWETALGPYDKVRTFRGATKYADEIIARIQALPSGAEVLMTSFLDADILRATFYQNFTERVCQEATQHGVTIRNILFYRKTDYDRDRDYRAKIDSICAHRNQSPMICRPVHAERYSYGSGVYLDFALIGNCLLLATLGEGYSRLTGWSLVVELTKDTDASGWVAAVPGAFNTLWIGA